MRIADQHSLFAEKDNEQATLTLYEILDGIGLPDNLSVAPSIIPGMLKAASSGKKARLWIFRWPIAIRWRKPSTAAMSTPNIFLARPRKQVFCAHIPPIFVFSLLPSAKRRISIQKCLTKPHSIYMINLILFGPPGSGKGTQAAKLVEKYELLHISTGDLFRYEMGNNTPLGQEAKSYIEKGELVPDEVTVGMLRNKVEANLDVEGYIFDGFPRTIPQADALDNLLAENGNEVSLLLMLDVPDDELVKRLLLRGETSGRADDTDESIIRNRIEVYKSETTPVFDYYAAKGRASKVYGVGSIEEIFGRLCAGIDRVA